MPSNPIEHSLFQAGRCERRRKNHAEEHPHRVLLFLELYRPGTVGPICDAGGSKRQDSGVRHRSSLCRTFSIPEQLREEIL